MGFRNLLVRTLGLTSLLAIAALPASAAVTVVGKGQAQSCYQAAQFNGDTIQGIATCTAALEEENLTPADRAATYVNRGNLRARSKNYTGALEDYNSGIEIKDTLGEAYVDRGALYVMLKRYKDAIADINKGLALGTENPHIAYYDRAIANEALGDTRGAYEDYKHAVTLAPDFTLAIEQLKRFKVVRRPAADGS